VTVLRTLLAALLLVIGAGFADLRVVMPMEPPEFDPRVGGEVVSHPNGPPPLTGGTLLVLADGHHAAVSDPDRDRLVIVDLEAGTSHAIALASGAEPGRLIEDAAGRIHVVLRGSGEIATLMSASADAITRRAVCPMPRGIAYLAARDELAVACRSGELVTMSVNDGPIRSVFIERDLRDVIASGDDLLVTRFRSAEVLVVRNDAIVERRTIADVDHEGQAFQNEVAWRMVPTPNGEALVLHQRASRAEIVPSFGGYGAHFGSCRGIVRNAVSIVGSGDVRNGPEIDGTLAIDLAMRAAPDGRIATLAVVRAGDEVGTSPVVVVDLPSLDDTGCRTTSWSPHTPIPNAVAVAFAPDGRMLVQERNPAALVIVAADRSAENAIDLGGDDTFDTGHAIFHAATGAAISCASCHPEGGEDGHVWTFSGLGARRTPALHAAAGTAPFHWTGEIADIDALMNDVFVGRMGGTTVDAPHARSVESWMAHLRAPRESTGNADAITRGHALFEREGCTSCHAGARFTSAESHDVGTGGTFQVPSLVGAADRLPLMHTGCATSLRARFDPACGGDRHGPALSEAETNDLVAFLESI
jgi:hypothetical protein